MKVKIKTWRQMEKEFGLDRHGDIKCEYCFVKMMEKLMPKDRVIKIEPIVNFWIWYDKNRSSWQISNDMISKIY